MNILNTSFYSHSTVEVAQKLLGKILVHEVNGNRIAGIIVETEAYVSLNDPASHAFKGQTPRNAPLFGPVGHSYVYFVYGIHFCFNIVAKDESEPAGGILIRALEPTEGIDRMMLNRKNDRLRDLTNGPGRLTQALEIGKKQNGLGLIKENSLYVEDAPAVPHSEIVAGPRIGIKEGLEHQWRFYIAHNQFVSR